jgi:hypothetical protein
MNGGTKLIIPGLSGIYDGLGPWSVRLRPLLCSAASIMVHGYFKLFAGGAPG